MAARVKAESGDVQLREAPSPFAAEVGRLRPGTPLLARELRGDWVAVTIEDGRRGFVPVHSLEVP